MFCRMCEIPLSFKFANNSAVKRDIWSQNNLRCPLSVSLTVSLCLSLQPSDAKIHCVINEAVRINAAGRVYARASPPGYCYNDLVVKNISTNSAARRQI